MPLAGKELLFAGNSFACEWATTMLRHWTHSSAFLPSLGFRIKVWFSVNISKAFGIFLAPLDTFTDLIWLTSMDSPPLWKNYIYLLKVNSGTNNCIKILFEKHQIYFNKKQISITTTWSIGNCYTILKTLLTNWYIKVIST